MQKIIQEKFTQIDSTHSYMLRQIKQQKEGFYLVTAEEQTGGYGQRGSCWLSPKGNLYCTMAFNNIDTKHHPNQLLAYCILKVLEQHNIKVQFKWPNDLLVNSKKLCGILSHQIENRWILSFGLNVNTPIKNFFSMKEATKKHYDLQKLALHIVQNFQQILSCKDKLLCIKVLRENLAFKGQCITYEMNNKTQETTLIDLSGVGGLVVKKGALQEELLTASNIRPARKAPEV